MFMIAAALLFSAVPASAKATDFLLNDLNGKPISSNIYKGKAVLLAFFRTECPACQDEMPQIEPLYKKYRSKKFDIVGISVREDADVVKAFARDKKLSFTVVLDDEGGLASAYQVRFIPRLILLDKSGKIKFTSYSIPAQDLEKEIKKLL